MKKHLLGVICLYFFFQSTAIFSQNHDCILGLEFGAGIRSLHGEEQRLLGGQKGTGVGTVLGLSLQKFMSNEFSIKTSLLLARKGARTLEQAFDRNGNLQIFGWEPINFTYISLPLLFRYEFGRKVRYFMNMGPFISILIRHPYSDLYPNLYLTDTANALDWGLSSGIGGQIPLQKNLFLSFEIRNNLGFHDMSDYNVFSISSGALQTRSTNLLIGISWGLK